MFNTNKLLHIYISILFAIKMLLVGLIIREYYLKFRNTIYPNELYVDKLKRDTKIKDSIEKIFLFCIYLLIMYLFYPYSKVNVIHTDDHMKMLLFATGFVSILHLFSKN